MEAFLPPDDFPEREVPFKLSSDPKAIYKILDVRLRSDGTVEVDTWRQGPSGVSYAERLIDLTDKTFVYLRDAASMSEFEVQERKRRGVPAAFVEGSISDLIARHSLRLVRN